MRNGSKWNLIFGYWARLEKKMGFAGWCGCTSDDGSKDLNSNLNLDYFF